ncbi:hypothetical protein HPHPA4_0282 [Helicobacter pylori Hp A-4]|nr:hypothetical protein HPHPA4_0282 [Helicobacter pylori Hp A-4]
MFKVHVKSVVKNHLKWIDFFIDRLVNKNIQRHFLRLNKRLI